MLTFCKILLNAKFSFMNYTSNCVAFHFTIQSRNSCGLRCISTTTISLNSRKPGIVRHKILDRDFVQALKGVVNNPKSIRDGLSALAVETKKYFEEKREKMDNFNRIFEPRRPDGNIDILFKFEKNEDLDNFFVTTDSANEGGYSSASLKITPDKTAMFSGFLSTTPPKDGKTKYAGYANMSCKRKMKSFFRLGFYDWRLYTHLVLKVRGDGRPWLIILATPGKYDVTWGDQFSHPLYTRGGPYWQVTKIPFSHFFYAKKGFIHDVNMTTVPLNMVARLGLSIADAQDGPFKLEIDYIGLERQDMHKDITPYENYYFGPLSYV